jgi:hypothetical protein
MSRRPHIWLAVPLLLTALVLGAAPAFAAHAVKVSPNNMHGWAFVDDNTNGPGSGQMVAGPGDPPLGKGSAQLTVTSPVDRQMLSTLAYQGTRLADITALSYWTYQVDASHAMPFQLDIRYHPTDTGYQGRLVFEPGNGNGAGSSGVWERWSPLSGRWWASKAKASGGQCLQASPCTWQEVLTNWPDASILYNVLFKAGGGWGPWTGNVDAFTIGTSSAHATTYNFEPASGEGQDLGDGADAGESGDTGSGNSDR